MGGPILDTHVHVERSASDRSALHGVRADEPVPLRFADGQLRLGGGRQSQQLRLLPLHHYCIVRADIPRGLAFAQFIHAAAESARISDEYPTGTHAVALEVHSEAALAGIGRALSAAGYKSVAIVEDDAPYEGQLMAIGVAALQRTPALKKILGKLRKIQ